MLPQKWKLRYWLRLRVHASWRSYPDCENYTTCLGASSRVLKMMKSASSNVEFFNRRGSYC